MKRIIGATLILLFAFSSTVSAHTGLTSSSPADGEDITEDVYEIVLEFNTKIETTSSVKVFNENKEEIIVSNTQVSDNVMTGGFASPLDNGTYTVEWKIIGADGHPIQGTYLFTVSQDTLEDPAVPEEAEETPTTPLEESIEKPVEQAIEDSSKIASNDALVVILVILFTIAGGFFGWIIGRRQSK
ncbi:copper resistance protein CopC [Sporosarcina sp. P12(2017)]|uniref:copper resistance CopC family protein n=1 Tax=unclassified Sporosarcina TaxID=2647733 RepID=UPI000C1660E4|nr:MULTISPECIES: copper resistance protein CopC [unclassified Sporosarcina]PIC56999.1 copper resistance protein CopC [Sporosarcina sp. P10]PIC60382.1 copper resistance protein CopC [Sporosarcina sp. P12(2017)]